MPSFICQFISKINRNSNPFELLQKNRRTLKFEKADAIKVDEEWQLSKDHPFLAAVISADSVKCKSFGSIPIELIKQLSQGQMISRDKSFSLHQTQDTQNCYQ